MHSNPDNLHTTNMYHRVTYKNQQTNQMKEQIIWCLTHSFDTDFYTLQEFASKQQYDATKARLHKIADRFKRSVWSVKCVQTGVDIDNSTPHNSLTINLVRIWKNVNKRKE